MGRTVQVMIQDYVSVDLSDIEESDLIEELKRRKKIKIIEEFELEPPRLSTMNDKAKYDFILENFDKITLEQLEKLV